MSEIKQFWINRHKDSIHPDKLTHIVSFEPVENGLCVLGVSSARELYRALNASMSQGFGHYEDCISLTDADEEDSCDCGAYKTERLIASVLNKFKPVFEKEGVKDEK